MNNKERFICPWIKKGLIIGGTVGLSGLLSFSADQGQKSLDVYGQPLSGWPTYSIATATLASTVTPIPTATPDIQATVRAAMTASAPTPDMLATIRSILASSPASAGPTPDILATVHSVLVTLPTLPAGPTPIILRPEIVKPEVVKPEIIKPEIVTVIVPQPGGSRPTGPDTLATAQAAATLDAMTARDRAAMQATATAEALGTATAEARQTATAEVRQTPVRVSKEEGFPWGTALVCGSLGLIAGAGALILSGYHYRENVITYVQRRFPTIPRSSSGS